MKNIGLIFGIRLRLIFKYFTPGGHKLPRMTFFVVLSLFLIGGYYTFFKIFSYLNTVEIIGPAIMTRTIEMILFVFFLMLLFSNIISSFSTFYNNQELNFLFSLPISPTTIYLAKLFENALYSSWATFAMAIPLFLAYGISNKAPFIYYPISLISFVIFLLIPAGIASIIIFLIVRLFPRLKPKNIIFLSLTLILLLMFLYIKIGNPGLLRIFETENEQELMQFAANLTTVGGAYVPSTWLSNILKDFVHMQTSGFFYLLLLITFTASIVCIAYTFAYVVYHKSFINVTQAGNKTSTRKSILTEYQTNPDYAFLQKDILLFIREPTQWVQLAIFIVLLIVYIFSLRRTPIFFSLSLWNVIISFANFAYVSFVIATLGVRFIFPAMSLEKKGIWIISSSPFCLKRTILIKYLFYLVIGIALMETLLVLANFFIRTAPTIFYFSLIVGMFVAASLVSINLGMGCIFPQFNEDNPSKIASGSGGIISALISIAYIALVVAIFAAPVRSYLFSWYFRRPLNLNLVLFSFMVFSIITFCAIYLPVKIGINAMEKRDF